MDLQFRVYYYPHPQPLPEADKFHKSETKERPLCDTHTSLTGPFLVDTSRISLTDRLTRLSGLHFGLILVKQYYIIFIFYSMCQIDFPSSSACDFSSLNSQHIINLDTCILQSFIKIKVYHSVTIFLIIYFLTNLLIYF